MKPPAATTEAQNGATSPIPIVELRPARGVLSFGLAELWRFRELGYRFAGRDVTLRYRQTGLGVSWVLLQPLLGAAVLAFVFGKVAKLDTEGQPYFLFAFTGFTMWTLFSGLISRAAGSLVGNAALVSKVYFPRALLPLSSAGSVLLDFCVALGLLAVLLATYSTAPGLAVLTLPVWMALALALALGVGMATAATAVKYRDVQYVLPVAMQLLLYASPVAYATSAVPENLRTWFELNPLTGVLDGFRWAMLGTPAPATTSAISSVCFAVVALLVGAVIFSKAEREFADRI